jgi:hypothetical protein
MGRSSNTKLKKAFTEESYTPEMLIEVKKVHDDPIYFCRNYVYIKHPTKGQILFDLYDYEEDLMLKYQYNRFNIVLSARQTGKTETTAAYLLWYAMHNEVKNILIASNKSDNAMDIISKIQNSYEELPSWLKPGINQNNWNKHTCEFENKSIIRAETTSETSGRSKSISLLFCDEFAWVPDFIQEEFWAAILPTLSTGGSCIIASTPNGDSDKFAELWRQAELSVDLSSGEEYSGNELKFVPTWIKWDMPPDRDEKFREGIINLFGMRKWLQEYECHFLGEEGTLLDNRILIERENKILEKNTNVLFTLENIPFFVPIKMGTTYLVGVDPATGTGSDHTVVEICEFPSLEQVMEFRSNSTRSTQIYELLKKIFMFFTNNECEILFSVENNGVGEGIISLYDNDEELPVNVSMIHESGKARYGFTTTDSIKLKYANKLKTLIENDEFNIHSVTLLKELKNYVRRGKAYEAKRGSTDDCISAILIIIRILDDLAENDEEAYNKLYSLSITKDDYWDNEDMEIIDDFDDSPPFIV